MRLLQMTPQIPTWAQDWYNDKLISGVAKNTLGRYLWSLDTLKMNLAEARLREIKALLAQFSQQYKPGTMRLFGIVTKEILTSLGREKDAKQIRLPKHGGPRVVVYSQQDIKLMLDSCRNLREYLLVAVTAEIGARRGELFNMKIRDIQFDEHSAIIWLRGKTGTRTRRVYNSVPEILEYLKQHPHRTDPEAPFWLNKYGRRLAYAGVYKMLRRIGLRALGHAVYPHGFRHTAATKDVKTYTDREMMIRYGWSRPDMVQVYAHLTARDVDEKDLRLHGAIEDPLCVIEARLE
jgi:integrase